MKKLKAIICVSALLGLFACSLSSCKKTWLCEMPLPSLLCIRGTDTVYSIAALDDLNSYSSTYMQNLRHYYEAMGYTVYNGQVTTTTYTTNKVWVEALEQNGVTCIAQ